MHQYDTHSHDYFVAVDLEPAFELPQTPESLQLFFARIKEKFPALDHVSIEEKSGVVLEDKRDGASYGYVAVYKKLIRSGFVNPPDLETAHALQVHFLERLPDTLGISSQKCEALSLVLGFLYNYDGNQSRLVAETLGLVPAFKAIASRPGAIMLSNDVTITLALDESGKRLCRLDVQPRTTEEEIRGGKITAEQLTVSLTVRHSGSPDTNQSFVSVLHELYETAHQIMDEHVIDQVLLPLLRACEGT